jgi:3',5'-cyclic AMP phosphodiesterase CpdA
MPFQFRPLSRRSLLRSSLTIGAGLISLGCANRPFSGIASALADSTDDEPDHWALLSDPHIAADPQARSRGVVPADRLNTAVAQVLAMDPSPRGVILNGDCARSFGRTGDYHTFRQLLIEPLMQRGLPLHLTLGNHDHRARFINALADHLTTASPVEDRIASIIRGEHANLFLLDTLDRTGWLSGTVGEQQLEWLDDSLAANADRPAIVIGHHPPGNEQLGFLYSFGTIRDSRRMWSMLKSHAHVQAYVFGHTHRWNVTRSDGIYLVNLPATSFAFIPGQPTGWVEMNVTRSGATVSLRRLGGAAPATQHRSMRLAWV